MLAQKLIIFTQTLRKYVELFHIITSQLSIRKKKKKRKKETLIFLLFHSCQCPGRWQGQNVI